MTEFKIIILKLLVNWNVFSKPEFLHLPMMMMTIMMTVVSAAVELEQQTTTQQSQID